MSLLPLLKNMRIDFLKVIGVLFRESLTLLLVVHSIFEVAFGNVSLHQPHGSPLHILLPRVVLFVAESQNGVLDLTVVDAGKARELSVRSRRRFSRRHIQAAQRNPDNPNNYGRIIWRPSFNCFAKKFVEQNFLF